jgi:hypothetical protein
MTEQECIEIFKDQKIDRSWEGDNAFKGLIILSKYTDNLIQGAGNDIIYSEVISVLIEKGITKEDCIELRKLNCWMIAGGSLACYV